MQNSEELIKYTLGLMNQNIKVVNENKIAAYEHMEMMEEKFSFVLSEGYSDEETARAENDRIEALKSYKDLCDEETACLTDRNAFLKETA
jgi:hypothetical protein